MPVGKLLILVRTREDRFLGKVRAYQLQADRQAIREAARYGKTGQASEIRTDRIDVIQVHGDRIIGFLTDGKCCSRRRWTCNDIDICKCIFEVLTD